MTTISIIISISSILVIGTLITVIVKLNSKIQKLDNQINVDRVHYHKDLSNIEKKVNEVVDKEETKTKHADEIERLNKLVQDVNGMVDKSIEVVEKKTNN